MFNKEIFIKKTKELQIEMKSGLRGKLNENIENKIIDDFSELFLNMVDTYSEAIQLDKNIPAIQRVAHYPKEDRIYFSLINLLDKMEIDFSNKFALDLTHDLEKETEIGKIKIAFLDGIRRRLNFARNNL
jgi:hypothetical protein